MGVMDGMAKSYLSDNEVFADAFNFLLYKGERVIQAEELDTTAVMVKEESGTPVAAIQKARDVLKNRHVKQTEGREEKQTYLILGLEHQSQIDYAMPFRIMMYDTMQYSTQIEKIKKKNRILSRDIFTNLDVETAKCINAVSGLNVDIYEYQKDGGEIDMCLALENSLRNMLEEGKARGIEEGRVEGRAEGRREMVFLSVYEEDYSQERGAEKLGMPVGEFLLGYHQWLEKRRMICNS